MPVTGSSSSSYLFTLLRLYFDAIVSGRVTVEQLLGNFLTAPNAFADVSFLSYHPTFGTNGDDMIVGTGGDDLIWGLDGNDTIETFEGNDIVDGGNGDDVILMGVGRDIAFGGKGDDFISGNGSGFLSGGSGNDFLLGGVQSSFQEVSGGAGDDTIQFSRFQFQVLNSIRGDDGNDTIDATNARRIAGGRGNDTITGESSFVSDPQGSRPLNEEVIVTGDAGNDVIDYQLRFALPSSRASGGQGDDLLSGVGRLNGDEGNDVINLAPTNVLVPDAAVSIASGGSGNDRLTASVDGIKTLLGNEGNDVLSGSIDPFFFTSTAVDTMTGGAGQDRFVLGDQSSVFYSDLDLNTANDDTLSTGFAIITDFTIGQDVIQLKGSAADYRLDLFSGSGVSRAALFYTKGQTVPERIAILTDAPNGLSLSSTSFSYV